MGGSGFCSVCDRAISNRCEFHTCPHERPFSQPAFRDLVDARPSDARAIREMSGKQFELFVRNRLVEQGYDRVKTTAASGDMGADLIAEKDGRTVVVQCKRYSGVVGIQAVQEVIGAKHFDAADEAWVVTDSTFTKAARNLARAAKVRLRRLVAKAP
jgi:HJR/Mrr/RecB family endonuclease